MSKNLFKSVMNNEEKMKQEARKEFEERGRSFLAEFSELQTKYNVKVVPVMQKYGLDIEVVDIKPQKNENQTEK